MLIKKHSLLPDTLKQKLDRINNQKTILFDVSGSMANPVADGRKIDLVKEIYANVREISRCFAFSSRFLELNTPQFPAAEGSTAMDLAFNQLKALGRREFILVTDGLPNSASLALEAAKDCKIEIIYIGPDPIPAFLNKLGNLTSVNMLQKGSKLQLENKIKGYLK